MELHRTRPRSRLYVVVAPMHRFSSWAMGAAFLAWIALPQAQARIVDNFDDNLKTDWSDFTFQPGFGLPIETNGQFRFELPPAGVAIFTASQKTSDTITLQEGRTVELRVDVVQAGGKDSFAVLAFLPTGNSPGTLAGYGLAKSTTDVLLTKGVNRYFVADAGPAAQLINENITLVLQLTAQGGNVVIVGKVLDKANNDAVIWERKVVDTPAADVMAAGQDSPAAPFITGGYFTLYCYQDFDRNAPEDPYRVYYDNAQVFVTDRTVLDNFDDNTKTDWADFTFQPGFGLPQETGGQFRFELPPAGQAIFTASEKTSRLFEIAEGERLEFQIDVVEAGGKDSFAVLAFIPKDNSLGTLSGYGFAKSTTDVLLTKGVNRYFVADAGPAAQLKNEDITMSLLLTRQNGNVIITGKVLDRSSNNAVIWERTVVDTAAADVMAAGTDSPAAPFATAGYFALYCYQDFDRNAPEDPYRVFYDNAIVSAPPLATNSAPLILEVLPADFSSFLPPSTVISFKVTDDKALADAGIEVTLNGTTFTTTNGLSISTTGATKTVTLSGLSSNVNYLGIIRVEDADGAVTSRTLYFDTFAPGHPVIEVEDYNFEGGKFIDNPVIVPEGSQPQSDAYSLQAGVSGVDFNETRATPRAQDTLYRPNDPVRMQHSRDQARAQFTAGGGQAAGIYDYDVIDIAAGEWLNYTRTFPAGSYEVYLREALANMTSGESVLEMVTGNPGQPEQTTRLLGSFLGERTGFQYRNFPLTDGTGQNKIILRLSGQTTLRLRQVTADPADGGRYQNYLLFVPVADPGLQRATIASLFPAPGSTVDTVTPAVAVEIQNRDTSVRPETIRLEVNGALAAPAITTNANGVVLNYPLAPLPASGATNRASLIFQDNFNASVTSEWSFVVTYLSLDPAHRRTEPGAERGFRLRMVQAPTGSALGNDLQRAEDQLAPGSTIPIFIETNAVVQVINLAEDERTSGFFPGEAIVPGLSPAENGTDDFAVEIKAWLELSAGAHRFGVVTDDGYKISSGASPQDKEPVLAHHTGGTANETFDFIVPAAGLYPFRMVWYERGGNAYAEWFSVNPASGERILINDPNEPRAIKAYLDATTSSLSIQLESSAAVTGPYLVETNAVIDQGANSIRIATPGSNRFYRVRLEGGSAGAGVRIGSIRLEAGGVVVRYVVTGL